MESDKPPSITPALVTIAGDEQIKSSGNYSEVADGFTLSFGTKQGKFTFTHSKNSCALKAEGLLCYFLDFAKKCKVSVTTSFGGVDMELEPIESRVNRDGDVIFIELSYYIISNGEKSKKEIKLKAEILKGDKNEN